MVFWEFQRNWTSKVIPNFSLVICVGVASGVSPKSAWSPSYEKIILEIAKFWTTPVDGILLVYYKGLIGAF